MTYIRFLKGRLILKAYKRLKTCRVANFPGRSEKGSTNLSLVFTTTEAQAQTQA